MWRHDLEADVKETEYNKRQLEKFAQDRNACPAESCWHPMPKEGGGNEGFD